MTTIIIIIIILKKHNISWQYLKKNINLYIFIIGYKLKNNSLNKHQLRKWNRLQGLCYAQTKLKVANQNWNHSMFRVKLRMSHQKSICLFHIGLQLLYIFQFLYKYFAKPQLTNKLIPYLIKKRTAPKNGKLISYCNFPPQQGTHHSKSFLFRPDKTHPCNLFCFSYVSMIRYV